MKRFISLLTVLALCFSLFVPVPAEVAAAADEGIGEEIIIEAGDADFSVQGSWANDSSLLMPSGTPSWYTTGADRSAKFEINVDPGTYEVSWWRLSHTERNDPAVELTISYNGKSETKTVSFEGSGIDWEPLGTYYFNGEGDEFLEFVRTAGNSSDIVTRTGAVRLVKVGGELTEEAAAGSGNAAEELLALAGVTEGITLAEGTAPTRAEFVKMAMTVIGVGSIAGDGNPMFIDVTAEHPYYGIIAAAIDYGIIHGDENGYFRAGDPVTYQEAVKIIVGVLGYEALASRAGGYPTGYLTVAARLDVLEGVDGSAFDGKQAATLLYNALLTEPVDISMQFTTLEPLDITALEAYHNIYFETEVVNGIDGLSLTAQAAPTGIWVRIGDVLLEDPEDLAAEYIGQRVTYYYTKGSVDTLLLIQAAKRNEVLDIAADEIVSAQVSGNHITVTYDDGDSYVKKADSSSNPQVVYNGQLLLPPYTDTDFTIESGLLRFISNDGGSYGLVLIYDYDVYVVGSVNTDIEKVYPKYRPDALDLSGASVPEYTLINDKNGKEMELDALKEWNVLNVLAKHSSQSTGPLTIRVTSKKVSGAIEEISTEGVKIKGKLYKISDSFLPYAGGLVTGDASVLGSEITVYTDISGSIVAAETPETNASRYVYGYQIRGDGGLEQSVTLRTFTSEGVWEDIKLADKVYFNGTQMDAAQITARDSGLINLTKFDEMVQVDSEEYVVSVTDTDKVVRTGSGWGLSTAEGVLGPNGEGSYYTGNREAKIIYSTAGVPAGTYGLYYWRAVLYTSTDGLDVTINHQGGTDVIRRDETGGNGRSWEFLGNYTFDGSSGDVSFQLSPDSSDGGTATSAGTGVFRTAAIKLGAPVLEAENPTNYLFDMALPVEQPLYIEKNAAGEIKTLDMLTSGGSLTGWLYYSNNRAFVNNGSRQKIEFAADSNTVIFGVPADTSDTDRYRIVALSGLTTERVYTVQPFELTETLKTPVMLMRTSGSIQDGTPACVLVNKISRALNSQGETVTKLDGYQGGSALTFTGADKDTFSNVKVGDVILAGKNKNGDTESDTTSSGYQVLFSYDTATPGQTGGNIHSDYCIAFGTVTQPYEGGSIAKINIGSEERLYYLNGATVYIYQTGTKKVTVGSLGEVSPEDEILVRIRRGGAREVVLYR